tara:strand:- start:85885 stop:87312 length:1428 start_codon:yes stop_codon:yes gene_type:complete
LINRTTAASRFEALWLAETIRLQELESHSGQYPRSVSEQLPASLQDADLEQWLLDRAQQQTQAQGLRERMQAWTHSARLLLFILLTISIISGAGAAFGFFGSDIRSVNVIWTLIGLIGVHFLALLLWLFGGRLSGGILGRLWFWGIAHWPRGRQQRDFGIEGKLAKTLAKLMQANGLGQWTLSSITHSAWLLALLASLGTMLLALSLRSYSFVLETTILSEAVFSDFVVGFGYLPSLLGFAIPDPAMIASALSGDALAQPELARRAWASWLSGGLIVYAILPRFLVWAISLLRFFVLRARLHLDLSEPGFAEFARSDTHSRGVVDAANTPPPTLQIAAQHQVQGQGSALLGLELGTPLQWPPQGLVPGSVEQLFTEIVESREQRRAALQALRERPPRALLVACDARLSPDRGSLHYLVELSNSAGELRIWLLQVKGQEASVRLALWQESLARIGLPPAGVMTEEADALAWVTQNA